MFVDYVAHSMTDRGGGDFIGTIDKVRKEIIETWDKDSDLVEVVRITKTDFATSGFIGFNRHSGRAFWIIGNASGPCRAVSPKTGRLGAKMPAPKGTREYIRKTKKSRGY